MEKLYLLTHKALKCLPNTFSEYDEKIARLEKENKSLKAQIEECKGINRRHRKRPCLARRFDKRIFEKSAKMFEFGSLAIPEVVRACPGPSQLSM